MNAFATTVLAGAFVAGAMSVPAHAADKGGSGGGGDAATYSSDQTTSITAEVDQNSGMVVRPHQTEHYDVTNISQVGQYAENTTTTVTESHGNLRTKNTVKQKASNTADVDQGTVKALPHSTLYYYGTNISYIGQYAENTTTTVTKSHGNLRTKNTVKQKASNTADVDQGTVKALPHSTVYYEGTNESYIWQHAENSDTTVTESGGALASKETVVQGTSNTAEVEQGVVEEFKHSTVHGSGNNTSVVVQTEDNTDN